MNEKIIEILRNTCALEENEITLGTKLKEISLDSLSFIEALVNIEQEFGVEFSDEDLNIYDWDEVKDIVKYVEGKTNGL